MSPAYWSDRTSRLHHGDVRQILPRLPDGSADCVVTAVPAYRSGGKHLEGHFGDAETPAAYLHTLRQVFAEIYRILAADGTCWISLDDHRTACDAATGDGADQMPGGLLCLPWRAVTALREDGWIVRDAAVISPALAPPNTVGRFPERHRTLFLLAKQRDHWFAPSDWPQSPRCPCSSPCHVRRPGKLCGIWRPPAGSRPPRCHDPRPELEMSPTCCRQHAKGNGTIGGNACTAPLPSSGNRRPPGISTSLAFRCVQAACRPGGKVLDPFAATGNVGIAARRLGLRFVGSELSACRCALIACRLNAVNGRDLPRDGRDG
ncbi:DNA-methyltransferase [Actinomadura rupiterrae]|uniref:DNA-methyltransferase n=1 Tax=Actinomadura rupiterrae TaxID=559627 RepID=UPI0020A5D190|nr:DNA methyltransferase [Actinomadura rupiterrae]MCP2337477.1 hypothetical protein [Actinomadura rupiterrae]